MKKTIYLSMLIIALPLLTVAQWPSNVTPVESKPKDSVTVSGDLANGAIMEDLSWAASSSNACFVSLQNWKFSGNHVLYATTMPPRSIMIITVSPVDANGNLSLYGYMMGGTEHRVVPDLPSCITCEADYKWDRPVKNKVQTSERKIEFQNPTKNTYNIVIGVSAPKDVTTGQFNLKIKLKP
jgi:hypothetical protein